MILNPAIFRAYDIRGEAFLDFDEDGFYKTAYAFGKYIQKKHGIEKPKVFVSGDGRLSMDQLYPAVITGLETSGCDVVWGGITTTPVNYFAFHEGSFDAAIQISASHNPAKDNGLKLTDKDGAVAGDEIQVIKDMALCDDCPIDSTQFGICKKNCRPVRFEEAYKAKLKEITKQHSPKKLVIDAGNGVAGIIYPEILKAFGHEIIELYCNLDTNFPNHQPDPERKENLVDLIKQVKSYDADYGVAFDGDGDRCGIILNDGSSLSADKILAILSADLLKRIPNAPIVVDAMSSATLHDKIRQWGGEVILSKTGHSHIEHAMKAHKAPLGGEQSGHMMFAENFYGHDDACLGTLRVLTALEDDPSLIDEVTTNWPELIEFSEKMIVEEAVKFAIIEKVQKLVKEKYPEASTLDGVRIDYGDGEWAIIRASNTTPKIAVRIEAKNEASLNEKKAILLEKLEEAKDLIV